MALEPLEQLILYWIGEDGPDHIYLGFFTDHLDPDGYGSPGYQDLRTECHLAGVQLPTKQEFLKVLQSLLDRGYAAAEIEENVAITDACNQPDAWEVCVFATDAGARQADRIRRKIEADEQHRRAEFTRQYLKEISKRLPFEPALPPYLMTQDSLLAKLEILAYDDLLTFTYDQAGNAIEINQTSGELAQVDKEGSEPISQYENLIGRIHISVREYQPNPSYARLVLSWQLDGVNSRVVITRDGFGDPVGIDDTVRRRARKIARSLLDHGSTEVRVSTK